MEITNDLQTILGREKQAAVLRNEVKESSVEYADRIMNAKIVKEIAEEQYAYTQNEDAGREAFFEAHSRELETGERFTHNGHILALQKKQQYDYSNDEHMRVLDAVYALKKQELHTVALERRATKAQMRRNGTATPVGEPKIVTQCFGLPKGAVIDKPYFVNLDEIA